MKIGDRLSNSQYLRKVYCWRNLGYSLFVFDTKENQDCHAFGGFSTPVLEYPRKPNECIFLRDHIFDSSRFVIKGICDSQGRTIISSCDENGESGLVLRKATKADFDSYTIGKWEEAQC